jgi:hypothetical protein
MFMKAELADGQNESTEAPWPGVLQMGRNEFEQSLAVAQLAVKLCDLKTANSKVPLEKENPDPEKYLADAWKLIQSAGRHVLRAQTHAEYLVAHGGSPEAAENVVGSILSASLVPFEKLCDPDRDKGDTEIIKLPDVETGKTIDVPWKVYRSERGFDDLFWDYWRDISEIRDREAWKRYGKSLLASWKRNGVPPNTFLALTTFRRERDDRAANLKNRRQRKRKRRESRRERIRKS